MHKAEKRVRRRHHSPRQFVKTFLHGCCKERSFMEVESFPHQTGTDAVKCFDSSSDIAQYRIRGSKLAELIKLINGQQQQIKSLVTERKILEDHVKLQNDRFVCNIQLLEDHIHELKDNSESKDLELDLQAAKFALLHGLKHREATVCKLILEQTEDEFSDFVAFYDRFVELNTHSTEGDRVHSSAKILELEAEIKRQKDENERLGCESGFLWNQYNVLENNLTAKLMHKEEELRTAKDTGEIREAELREANQRISELLASIDVLRSSSFEKDRLIHRLETRVVDLESEMNKRKEAESEPLLGLELGKGGSFRGTPPTKKCRPQAKSFVVKFNGGESDQRNIIVKKEAPSSQKGSKRKRADEKVASMPKLFTSAFKVPKLKTTQISDNTRLAD